MILVRFRHQTNVFVNMSSKIILYFSNITEKAKAPEKVSQPKGEMSVSINTVTCHNSLGQGYVYTVKGKE